MIGRLGTMTDLELAAGAVLPGCATSTIGLAAVFAGFLSSAIGLLLFMKQAVGTFDDAGKLLIIQAGTTD